MYERPWNSTTPGCLIVLLDQSGSMEAPFGGLEAGEANQSDPQKRTKSHRVATLLNRVLADLIDRNTSGEVVKPRAEIAVLGYGGGGIRSVLPTPLDQKDFATLVDLMQHPLKIESRTIPDVDDAGNVFDRNVDFRVWVKAAHSNGTPMCAAFRRATELAQRWATGHQQHYPPVVVHVTDGESTDGDPTAEVERLRQVSTADGTALVFNCHISSEAQAAVEFPASELVVPTAPFAQLLFKLSSEIPDSGRDAFRATTGTDLVPGTRGYIFNGDAVSVRKMFNFASTPAQVVAEAVAADR